MISVVQLLAIGGGWGWISPKGAPVPPFVPMQLWTPWATMQFPTVKGGGGGGGWSPNTTNYGMYF